MDVGGGGTTAKYLGQQLGVTVIDCGPGIMNMHSPFEVIGIAEIYSAISVYKIFFEME